jgi:hypothetical protein
MGAVGDVYRSRVIAELKKPAVEKGLRCLAFSFTRSPQDAKDLLQAALTRVVDPRDAPWDPAGAKDFVLHVGGILGNLAANRRRSAATKHEVLATDLAHEESAIDGAPLPEQALIEVQDAGRRARLRDALLAELDREDPEGAAVFRAILDDAEGQPAPPAPPVALANAEALRGEAERACVQQLWGACEQKLDAAKAIDPDGESQERVRQWRDVIAASRAPRKPGPMNPHPEWNAKPDQMPPRKP